MEQQFLYEGTKVSSRWNKSFLLVKLLFLAEELLFHQRETFVSAL